LGIVLRMTTLSNPQNANAPKSDSRRRKVTSPQGKSHERDEKIYVCNVDSYNYIGCETAETGGPKNLSVDDESNQATSNHSLSPLC